MPTNDKPYQEASRTYAVEGDVVILGPNSIGISVTPAAAETTAKRLVRSAKIARGQAERKARAKGPATPGG
jgi:hypothetical protein